MGYRIHDTVLASVQCHPLALPVRVKCRKMFRIVLRDAVRSGTAAKQARILSLKRNITTSTTQIPFDWRDPLASANLFTEEELAIAETAKAYCQERMLPRILGELSTDRSYLKARALRCAACYRKAIASLVLTSRMIMICPHLRRGPLLSKG